MIWPCATLAPVFSSIMIKFLDKKMKKSLIGSLNFSRKLSYVITAFLAYLVAWFAAYLIIVGIDFRFLLQYLKLSWTGGLEIPSFIQALAFLILLVICSILFAIRKLRKNWSRVSHQHIHQQKKGQQIIKKIIHRPSTKLKQTHQIKATKLLRRHANIINNKWSRSDRSFYAEKVNSDALAFVAAEVKCFVEVDTSLIQIRIARQGG